MSWGRRSFAKVNEIHSSKNRRPVKRERARHEPTTFLMPLAKQSWALGIMTWRAVQNSRILPVREARTQQCQVLREGICDSKYNPCGRPQKIKNTKGQIRTVDLTGMSRALSPTELLWHKIAIFCFHCPLSWCLIWLRFVKPHRVSYFGIN